MLFKYLNKNTRAVELRKDIGEYFWVYKTNRENVHTSDCDKSMCVHLECSSVVEHMLSRSQFDLQHSEQKKRARKYVSVLYY